MDNGTILFTTLLMTVVLGVATQIVLYKHRKKEKAEYPMLWEHFERSLKTNSYVEINQLGNKLIYNKFVKTEHLKRIMAEAEELASKNPAFEKLRLNAYDKWIHRTKGQGYGY